MMKVEYSKLAFPKAFNLGILTDILSDETLVALIAKHKNKVRKKRIIILPSSRTVRKIFFHHIWTLIEDGELTWELVKTDFKREFKTLKALDISKFEARRLYEKREREIARGQ